MTQTPAAVNPASDEHAAPAVDRSQGRWFGAGLLLAVALCAFQWWGLRERGADDYYITYRYAANVAAGNGLSYNPGEKYCGTTSPFLAVSLGFLHRLIPALPIPWAGCALGCLALLGLAAVHLRWMAALGLGRAGFLAVPLLFFNPYLQAGLGSEYLPALFFAYLAFHLADRKREAASGASLGLAMLFRSEVGFCALFLAAAFVIKHRTIPWRTAACSALILAAWMGALGIYFGTPFPATFDAKMAQGHSLYTFFQGGWSFGGEFFHHLSAQMLPTTWALLGGLAVAGFVFICLRRIPLLAAFWMWGAAHISLYMVMHVAYYFWYTLPLHAAAVLSIPLAFEPVVQAVDRRWRIPVWAAAAALFLGPSIPEFVVHARIQRAGFDQYRLYREAGEWCRSHLPKGAVVAHMEVGYLGFYSGCRLYDPLGLVTPEAPLQDVREGRLDRSILARGPDVVVLFPFLAPFARQIWENPEFHDRYHLVQDFQAPRCPFPLLFYARDDLPSLKGNVRMDVAKSILQGDRSVRLECHDDEHTLRMGLRQPPGRSWAFPLDVPPGAVFVSACSVPPEGNLTPDYAGVSGAVQVEAGGAVADLIRGTLKPQGRMRFTDLELSLAPFRGRTVVLKLCNEGPALDRFSNDILWDVPRVVVQP